MCVVSIEHAKPCHAEAIYALEHSYIDCPWTLEQIRAEIERKNSLFLVAVIGGRLVGYVSGVCAADECDINNVAVASDARRRGIGTELIRSLLSGAKARGIAAVFLSVRDDNGPAIGLYESVGFKKVGARARYYGAKTAIIMRLDIS